MGIMEATSSQGYNWKKVAAYQPTLARNTFALMYLLVPVGLNLVSMVAKFSYPLFDEAITASVEVQIELH